MFKSPIRINEFTGGIKHDQVKISPFAKSWWIQSVYSKARESIVLCDQLRYLCIGTTMLITHLNLLRKFCTTLRVN